MAPLSTTQSWLLASMLAKDTLLVSVAMKAQLLQGTEGSAGAGGGAVGGGEGTGFFEMRVQNEAALI